MYVTQYAMYWLVVRYMKEKIISVFSELSVGSTSSPSATCEVPQATTTHNIETE